MRTLYNPVNAIYTFATVMKKIIDFYRGLFKNNSQWFRSMVILFAVTFVIGIIAFNYYPHLVEQIIASFQERFGADPGLSTNLAFQIFIQNAIASVIALFGGLLLGLGSLLVVTVNGLMIGYIISWIFSATTGNFDSFAFLVLGGLVPHGIFEIPAFLIAATLGLRLGWEWMSDSAKENRLKVFKTNFKQALIGIPVILLMLLIAAFIEVFVSGWIVSKL